LAGADQVGDGRQIAGLDDQRVRQEIEAGIFR
jgi:hypothetical protein